MDCYKVSLSGHEGFFMGEDEDQALIAGVNAFFRDQVNVESAQPEEVKRFSGYINGKVAKWLKEQE